MVQAFLFPVVGRLVGSVRFYRKGLLRKPLRVITENEGSSLVVEKELKKQKGSINNEQTALITKDNNKPGNEKTLNIPRYQKLGEKDGEFLKLMSELRSRKHRSKSGRLLLEGKRLVIDAIKAGSKVESIFFSKEETLVDIPFEKIPDVKLMKVFYKKLSVWSDLTTCPGVMGVCKKPDYNTLMHVNENPIPLTVICDNVRDPGNLGSILRCGAAVGCHRILLTKGCVDPWETKVLRAACGAHFHMPVTSELSWDVLINYLPENADVFLADNVGDAQDRSLPKQVIDNSAGAQRFVERREETVMVDPSYEDQEILKKYKNIHIPQIEYTEAKYDRESVLVIGGETEGLSAQSLKLASDYNGWRIKIPTVNNIESLNSAMSMAIIAYEIKRQMCRQDNNFEQRTTNVQNFSE